MKRLLLCCAVIGLNACSPRYGGETLSRLEPQHMEPAQAQTVAVSAPETIASYRKLVALPVDNPFRARAMHRLADLLLDYGETREIKLADKDAAVPEIDEYGEAIAFYEELLQTYPDYAAIDQVLYQLARAYAKQGEVERSEALLTRLVSDYPDSRHSGESWFRLAELNFLYADFAQAQRAYRAVLAQGRETPYYEHALLKYSWTLFKREQFDQAQESFFALVELTLEGVQFDEISGEPLSLGKADVELIDDTLRGLTLIFAEQNRAQTLNEYAGLYGRPQYAHLFYQRLAEHYHKEERYLEEARVYQAFIDSHPDSGYAAMFQLRRVDAYRFAREPDKVIAAKEDFVTHYWPPPAAQGSAGYRAHLTRFARDYLDELSEYYHARYQKTRQPLDYAAAVQWYRRYLDDFHDAANAIEKHFLLAELLYEHGDYQAAGNAYEQVAYFYPAHGRAAEAGYSAILAYQQLLQTAPDEGEAWRALQRRATLRFVSTFPHDPRVPNTVLSLANQAFDRGDLAGAETLLRLLLDDAQALNERDAYAAWMLQGHIAHRADDHLRAEQAFQAARRQASANTRQALEAEEWLAVSMYKQAEALLAEDEKRAAVVLLLRIPEVAPSSKVAAQARYDAAAELIGLEEWTQAATLLEHFRDTYPRHELQAGVPAKLAFVYLQLGRTAEAARAYEQVAAGEEQDELRREALWQAAELYRQAGDPGRAALGYKRFLQRYPDAGLRAFQARAQLAAIYADVGQPSSRDYWRREIINRAAEAGASQDEAIQSLAARAAFSLAEEKYAEFTAVALVEPLRENLARKKQHMEAALQAYGQAAGYGYAEFVTAATQRSAQIYLQLSKALLAAPRPAGLDAEELEQYQLMLEEQAYPFEEQAIALLQTNAARMEEGIYNDWVRDSLAELARLLPLRYAKQELSSEVIRVLH